MADTLTLADALALTEIIHSAQSNRNVARLIDGKPYRGEAQSIRTADGGYVPPYGDIRDAYLSVRLDVVTGAEVLWSIRDLMHESNPDNWTDETGFFPRKS